MVSWSLLCKGLGEKETDSLKHHHDKRVWGGMPLKPSVSGRLGVFKETKIFCGDLTKDWHATNPEALKPKKKDRVKKV